MEVDRLRARGPVADGNGLTLRDRRVIAVRITGGRGVGKTTVIETTVRALSRMLRVGVVAEAVSADDDLVRLRAAGATVMTASPVDASTVRSTLDGLAVDELEYVFIEDVVDLAHPALADVGEQVTVLALPASDAVDAALERAAIVEQVDLVLLTKSDEAITSDAIERARERIARLMPHPAVLAVSARTGAGMDQWVRWVSAVGRRRSRRCALGAVAM